MVMKRSLDVIFSFLALIFLLPVIFLISLIIFIFDGNPIFFFQNRPGKDQKLFKLIKFKTMKNIYDNEKKLLEDSKRLTKIGRFLRKTSLDELPTLLNVLKGEMSVIGPRPLLKEYLPLYSEEQNKRHYVRPGITGWAQINGRNQIGWEEKFKLDVWYVNNRNLILDVKIFFLTIVKVIKREGISQDGEATMKKFRGND